MDNNLDSFSNYLIKIGILNEFSSVIFVEMNKVKNNNNINSNSPKNLNKILLKYIKSLNNENLNEMVNQIIKIYHYNINKKRNKNIIRLLSNILKYIDQKQKFIYYKLLYKYLIKWKIIKNKQNLVLSNNKKDNYIYFDKISIDKTNTKRYKSSSNIKDIIKNNDINFQINFVENNNITRNKKSNRFKTIEAIKTSYFDKKINNTILKTKIKQLKILSKNKFKTNNNTNNNTNIYNSPINKKNNIIDNYKTTINNEYNKYKNYNKNNELYNKNKEYNNIKNINYSNKSLPREYINKYKKLDNNLFYNNIKSNNTKIIVNYNNNDNNKFKNNSIDYKTWLNNKKYNNNN